MMLALLLCATNHHALVIGNNVPAPEVALATLHYADDDAAMFSEWLAGLGSKTELLTVLDHRSQERFPDLSAQATAPTLAALSRAIETIKGRIAADRAAGHKSVLWVYFSGHGHGGATPKLALIDGGLTQVALYAALDALNADLTHVIVDACHAEAIVRPRGASSFAPLNNEDTASFATQKTLAGMPHTGAIIASSADQVAHEWDGFEGGVFTHELLSALRGAADVNHDRKVEYSEAYAFLVAANREVSDVRARLNVVVAAPVANERAVLAEQSSGAYVIADAGGPRRFWVEDQRGVRLVDVHAEERHELRLSLPPEQDLFVRTEVGDARVRLALGAEVRASALRFLPIASRSRGAMSDALARGLFSLAYGPLYYRGFVDSAGILGVRFDAAQRRQLRDPSRQRMATALWIVAGATTVTALVFGALALAAADRFSLAGNENLAAAERRRYEGYGAGFLSGAGATAAFAIAGFAVFPWSF